MAKKEKGVALIIVIFGIMLLSVLGWTLVSLQSGDFDFNLRNLESERALFIAEAGIEEARGLINAADPSFDTDADSITRTLNYGQYRLSRSTVGLAIDVISTGYIPTAASPRATRIVNVTLSGDIFSNAIGGENIFDWSDITSGSEVEGSITAAYFDGDNNLPYNISGFDRNDPPNALPPPSSGYNRTVGAVELPEIDMTYYQQKAQEVGHNITSPYIYVASYSDGLRILNNDFTNPALAGSNTTTGTVFDVQGQVVSDGNQYTFLATSENNKEFKVVRINDPIASSVPIVANLSFANDAAYGVYVQPNNNYAPTYAYAVTQSRFRVIDISTPTNPRFASANANITLGTTAYGVCARANAAFVACGTAGLKIIDISNPNAPSLRWTYDTDGTTYGVYVRGKFAFLADGTGGLKIVNISTTPLSIAPVARATVATGGTCYNVYLRGNYTYAACGSAGLKIIDISNIHNSFFDPNDVNNKYTYDTNNDGHTAGDAQDVQISGDYAYVSCSTGSNKGVLKIINISEPTIPAYSGEYVNNNGNSQAKAVYLRGDRYFSGNINNDKIWYTKGNFMLGGGNYQKTTFVSEGDTELYCLSGAVLRAHVATSANENFPNIATKYGSVVCEGPAGVTKEFDGLIFSQKGSLILSGTIEGCSLIGYNIFLAGRCEVQYSGQYVGTPPNGIISGTYIQHWKEQ